MAQVFVLFEPPTDTAGHARGIDANEIVAATYRGLDCSRFLEFVAGTQTALCKLATTANAAKRNASRPSRREGKITARISTFSNKMK